MSPIIGSRLASSHIPHSHENISLERRQKAKGIKTKYFHNHGGVKMHWKKTERSFIHLIWGCFHTNLEQLVSIFSHMNIWSVGSLKEYGVCRVCFMRLHWRLRSSLVLNLKGMRGATFNGREASRFCSLPIRKKTPVSNRAHVRNYQKKENSTDAHSWNALCDRRKLVTKRCWDLHGLKFHAILELWSEQKRDSHT